MSDLDDSLDDLLADTSANKFKKTNYSNIKDDIESSVEPPTSRKEKKSALLAELFGPSSSTSFNFGGGAAAASNYEDENKISGGFGSMEKNTYSFSTEPIKKVDSFSLGGYTPSAPRTDNSKSRPSSSGSLMGLQQQSGSENSNRFFNNQPVSSYQHAEHPGINKQQMTSTVSLETEQPSYAQSPLKGPAAIPSTNVWNVPSSLTSTSAINYNNQQQSLPPSTAAAAVNIGNNPTTLNEIKDILEAFSANFCDRLQSVIVDKSEGLSEITNRLTELQQCISAAAASQHQTLSTAVDRNVVDENNSKKVAVLENKIEALNQENANLRSRLEHLENQVREGRSETIRAKAETESLVENNVKWMKEAVNSFDSKLSNYSSSMSKQVEEVASNRESVVRQIEKRVCELENKKSSNQQEQQVLHLLKEELKWLQRQKTRLKAERKESNILQKQLAAKVQHMEALSAVMNLCLSFGAFS